MSGRQIDRRHTQTIHAAPARMFPLLCPAMETRWLPGWTYRMVHSHSGAAEDGAVFVTPHPAGGDSVWLCTRHEPDARVAFARWQPDGLAVQIDIALRPLAGERSAVDIRYRWTSLDAAGDAALARLTPQTWTEMMDTWEHAMNTWLAR